MAGDKLMQEKHLRQLSFTYSACETFTKNKNRKYKFEKAGDSRYIYQKGIRKSLLSAWHGWWRF